MSVERGIRRFDLYDLFSILIPGSAFLIGLYPLLPAEISLDSVGLIAFVLIAGFIGGRGIHALAVAFDRSQGIESHREKFTQQLSNPTLVHEDIAREFLVAADEVFDEIEIPREMYAGLDSSSGCSAEDCDTPTSEKPTDQTTGTDDCLPCAGDDGGTLRTAVCARIGTFRGWGSKAMLRGKNVLAGGIKAITMQSTADSKHDFPSSLYVLVRAYVHRDGRGRSRSFQAIHAFHRSVHIGALLLAIIYFTVSALAVLLNLPLPYTPKFEEFGFEYNSLALISAFVLIGSAVTFRRAKYNYQEYYIQYLISDFLAIRQSRAALTE